MSVDVSNDIVVMNHTSGASAKVSLLGATLFSWVVGGKERFFISSKSPPTGPAAVRGGIPIVWPVFGPPPKEAPFEKLKQHGFARTSKWSFEGEIVSDDQAVGARFTLSPNETTKSVWKLDFRLEFIIQLSSTSLTTTLHVTNPTSATELLPFQALLHNYFLLPQGKTLTSIAVAPLKGLSYNDKVKGGAVSTESRTEVTFGEGEEVDKVYASAPNSLRLVHGDLSIVKHNLIDVVIWNPGPTKGDAFGDMEHGGWKRFVCVEPGSVKKFIELSPGETWTGGQTLTVES